MCIPRFLKAHFFKHIHTTRTHMRTGPLPPQDGNGDHMMAMEPPEDVDEMLAMMGYNNHGMGAGNVDERRTVDGRKRWLRPRTGAGLQRMGEGYRSQGDAPGTGTCRP